MATEKITTIWNKLELESSKFKPQNNPMWPELLMGNTIAFYESFQSHYSLIKGAVFLGMGSDNVVKIKTDDRGRMIPEDLEQRVKQDLENVNW